MLSLIKKSIPRNLGYHLRKTKLYLRGLFYRGNRYYCPLCGHHYRQMFTGGFDLPVITEKQIIGAGRRAHIICPGCASTDRDRLVYLYVKKQLDLSSNKLKILHIAPEPALASYLMKKCGKSYFPAAKYHEGFYYDKDIELFDIKDIPYPDGHFELIICNHVLEHIDDDLAAMKELFRVLNSGGKAILQVPWSPLLEATIEDPTVTDPKQRETLFGQFDHVRLYGKDYSYRLKNAGFEVAILDHETLIEQNNSVEQMALNKKEVIFVGEKQT